MTTKLAAAVIALKALRQLGPARLAENALYRGGLRFNLWRVPEPVWDPTLQLNLAAAPGLPAGTVAGDLLGLLDEVREIGAGQVRLFGGRPQPLRLAPPGGLRPWQDYERGRADQSSEDIKFTWEPARFGWAVSLARVYRATRDEALVECFWENLRTFEQANPPYRGENWISGQEAALRIVTWAFAARAFWDSPSSTAARKALLAQMIAAHARRIPPTLIYARSQDNNHLLSEAAGLFSAGWLLPRHPAAASWRREGWSWFNRGVQRQVAVDGTYIQQSLNYHRLLLQLALWVDGLARQNGEPWPVASRQRLAAAAHWLRVRLDPVSGGAPNLGHNDGTHLFPFGATGDFRPTAQAASAAFEDQPALPPGAWDELGGWLGLSGSATTGELPDAGGDAPPMYADSGGVVLRAAESWAALRAAHYNHRPGQADQLHVDLWWRGQNIALDAGTYRYNAPAPWNNGLAGGLVHNTVSIEGAEAMTRAGRFLWLDWDQAAVTQLEPGAAAAERTGYTRLGVLHRRSLEMSAPNGWRIEDELLAVGEPRLHTFWLHWLLPDWPWQLDGLTLRLEGPGGGMRVSVVGQGAAPGQAETQLIRAGERIAGEGDVPAVLGWFSPSYANKVPALSWRIGVRSKPPVRFTTWFAWG